MLHKKLRLREVKKFVQGHMAKKMKRLKFTLLKSLHLKKNLGVWRKNSQ